MTSLLIKLILPLALLTSTAGVCTGFWKTCVYEQTPGQPATAASLWPDHCPLTRDPHRPTLILALHPNCPCSRATLTELAQLVADHPNALTIHALFERPPHFTQDWATIDLWQSAATIPGVHALEDSHQIAITRFAAETSGQVFLYDTSGCLQFHGGITASRGHPGDNDGRAAIESFLATGHAPIDHTPVYGCALR